MFHLLQILLSEHNRAYRYREHLDILCICDMKIYVVWSHFFWKGYARLRGV